MKLTSNEESYKSEWRTKAPPRMKENEGGTLEKT